MNASAGLSGGSGYLITAVAYTCLVIGGVFRSGRGKTRAKTAAQYIAGHCVFLVVLLVGYLAATASVPYLPPWLRTESFTDRNGSTNSLFEIGCIFAVACLCLVEVLWIDSGSSDGKED